MTDKNYKQLQALHDKLAEEKGLRILAFPCNQFGGQVSYPLQHHSGVTICFHLFQWELFRKRHRRVDSALTLMLCVNET